jgi:acetylornithine deacetylase
MLDGALDIITKLVSFDTSNTEKSNDPIIQYIRSVVRDIKDVQILTVPSSYSKSSSLLVSVGPVDKPGIILSGHLDVVPAVNQNWATNPFQAVNIDGKLFGRGVSDTKGFIGTVLQWMKDLDTAKMKIPIHLVLTYDQETYAKAVWEVLPQLLRKYPLPIITVVGDATEMKIIPGHRGCFDFRLRFNRNAPLFNQPNQGMNPILCMFKVIEFLVEIANKYQNQADPSCGFDPPYTMVNIGKIQGGTAVNALAENCELGFLIRPIGSNHYEEISRDFKNYSDLLKDLTKQFPGITYEFDILAVYPPLEPEKNLKATEICLQFTELGEWNLNPFSSEGGFFSKAGIPTVLCGPGDIKYVHQANEFVELSQINKLIDFLSKMRRFIEK